MQIGLNKGNISYRHQSSITIRPLRALTGHLRHGHSPVQLNPFPLYPLLQVQLYEPIVFLHTPSSWQLCVPTLHSSISIIFKKVIIGNYCS